jgi:hypothetical protein
MEVDSRTGCAHYRSALNIVAIKFECCQTYYSCFYCHQVEADHSAHIWNRARFDEKGVLCGACGAEFDHPSVSGMPGGLSDLWIGLQSALRIALSFVLRDIGMTAVAMCSDPRLSRVTWGGPVIDRSRATRSAPQSDHEARARRTHDTSTWRAARVSTRDFSDRTMWLMASTSTRIIWVPHY